MYAAGRGGLLKNDVEAARLYQAAADQGHAGAQNNLGRMYEEGRCGLEQNYREAVRLYQLAAKQDHAEGLYNLALMHECCKEGLEPGPHVWRLWERAAEQGHAAAKMFVSYRRNNQYPLSAVSLTVIYREGKMGLRKDERETVRLLHLFADTGGAYVQLQLGRMYENGECGLQKDEKKAIRLYKLAAEEPGPLEGKSAKLRLGKIYENGECGVQKDECEAIQWYRKADADSAILLMANQGSVEAQYDKGIRYSAAFRRDANREGLSEYARGYKREAIKWLRMAAQQGHVEAKKELEKLDSCVIL